MIAVIFFLIVIARITDVSLDTVRTVAIVQGRRKFAAILGFIQAAIYISAIAKVLQNADQPVYMLAFALGFSMGTYLGIVIEQRLAFGQQVATLFTEKGPEMSRMLVQQEYRIARVQGHSHMGQLAIIYVEVARKRAQQLLRDAATIDEACFCALHDVRVVGYVPGRHAGSVSHVVQK